MHIPPCFPVPTIVTKDLHHTSLAEAFQNGGYYYKDLTHESANSFIKRVALKRETFASQRSKYYPIEATPSLHPPPLSRNKTGDKFFERNTAPKSMLIHLKETKPSMLQCVIKIQYIGTDRAKQTVQIQIRQLLKELSDLVCTVCHSIGIFLTHYYMLKSNCSVFSHHLSMPICRFF